MKGRCRNPNNMSFRDYGARGINFDPRWESFVEFLKDMGAAPSGMTLERVNNEGGYSRENCRWATRTEQNRNKRNNYFIECGGRRLTITEWSRERGIGRVTLLRRLQRGVPPEIALSTAGFLRYKH